VCLEVLYFQQRFGHVYLESIKISSPSRDEIVTSQHML